MRRFSLLLHLRFYILHLLLIIFSVPAKAQTFQVIDGDTINFMTSDSVRQGIWREYWINGNLKSEVFYVNGKKDGIELIYYAVPHCLAEEQVYSNGELNGSHITYSRFCKKLHMENYSLGVKNGKDISYHPSGKIKSEGNFKGGKLSGYYKHYDEKGKVKFESKSKKDAPDFIGKSDTPLLKDTLFNSIYRIMNRHTEWSKKLIVMDVTGSMYPFIDELLDWIRLEIQKDSTIKNFVFFNDGDDKPQSQKKIGSAGGLYTVSTRDPEVLRKLLLTAISKGGGGDIAENPVEAILEGLKKYPADEVILVADNAAPARDIKLATKINVPVHIILCSVNELRYVHPDYLSIAYLSKGSLHTMKKDLPLPEDIQLSVPFQYMGLKYMLTSSGIKLRSYYDEDEY